MPQTWFSPYPRITRGDVDALKELDDLDKEIDYLEDIISDLNEKRTKARNPATQSSSSSLNARPARTEGTPELHSIYLTIVENYRRAEAELASLREERLKLVLRAGLAFVPERRGSFFPHASLEQKAKEFIQMQKDRLLAVTTVAFFGSGITFSTIFSGTRGSVGLMSISWAAFTVSFSICVFIQYANPESLPYAVVAYPSRRIVLIHSVFLAGFASFVGIVLMGVAVATLDLRNEQAATDIDKRINTMWGGIVSLLPVVLGFTWGVSTMVWNSLKVWRIKIPRERNSYKDAE